MTTIKKEAAMIGGAILTGLALVAGARFLLREKSTPQPDYLTVIEDGEFELRDYAPIWVAQNVATGTRREAARATFRELADYIFARSHDGDELEMTVPVLQGNKGDDRWGMRFIMPAGEDRDSLPEPPMGVILRHIPARRYATVAFNGKPADLHLDREEARLRDWIEKQGLTPTGRAPAYAFYNSPAMPTPLRHNEVWIEIAVDPPVGK